MGTNQNLIYLDSENTIFPSFIVTPKILLGSSPLGIKNKIDAEAVTMMNDLN